MEIKTKDIKNLHIAYIGGGSKAWAKVLMNDLATEKELSGTVYLYDIDFAPALVNERVGNKLSEREDIVGKWKWKAVKTLKEALVNADFVFCSILPGTFNEMQSDVHLPEQYGIFQPVGDTTGPGGIIRTLRTVPMYKEIALAVKEFCPNAWVINFTNPMTACVKTLYKVFPQIKAFGCCHEVFGTQKLLAKMLKEKFGIEATKNDININIVGVNHFTWMTEAKYKGIDLFPIYNEFIDEHPNGIEQSVEEKHWANGQFITHELVKFALFKKYGYIACAGDRHLAEFCPGKWFLADKHTIEDIYGFRLTTVDWRIQDMADRRKLMQEHANDITSFTLRSTGEESVKQLRALLGLGDFVTNVNIPNVGQIPNNPLGAVVETNAFFSGDSVRPLYAGEVPGEINALIMRIIEEQEAIVDAALNEDYEKAFAIFTNNPNVNLPLDKARELFDKMLFNTKKYLPKDAYERYVKLKKYPR